MKILRHLYSPSPEKELEMLRKGNRQEKLELIGLTTRPGILAEAAQDKDPEIRQAVASHPDTPADTLRALAREEDPGIRLLAASNEAMPPDSLHVLARDAESIIREEALSNPNIQESDLLDALRNGNETESALAAGNENATALVLDTALGNPNPQVRAAAAANENAEKEQLARAAADRTALVRKAAMMNPHAQQDTLAIGLLDGNEAVRAIALLHANTSDKMAEQLKADPSLCVQQALKRRAAVQALEASLNLEPDPVFQIPRTFQGEKLTFAQRRRLSEGKTIPWEKHGSPGSLRWEKDRFALSEPGKGKGWKKRMTR